MSETPDIGFEKDTVRRDEGDITFCMKRMSLVLSGLGLAIRGYLALVAGHDVCLGDLGMSICIPELLYGCSSNRHEIRSSTPDRRERQPARPELPAEDALSRAELYAWRVCERRSCG